jgi:hypothetical protein
MAEYTVILDGLRSFGVEVTAPDGFRSVRGFPTEAAALLWIAEQTAREANACISTSDGGLVALRQPSRQGLQQPAAAQ